MQFGAAMSLPGLGLEAESGDPSVSLLVCGACSLGPTCAFDYTGLGLGIQACRNAPCRTASHPRCLLSRGFDLVMLSADN